MSTTFNKTVLRPETSSTQAFIGDLVVTPKAAKPTLRELNARANANQIRLMQLASANTQRLTGKPNL